MGDRFHALCDDRPVEGLTQADDSFQDDPIFDIFKHVAYKTLVDLQGRDLQPPQIGQRRIAGAKVVDRKSHTERSAGIDQLGYPRYVLQGTGLKDFELEAVWRQ